MTSPHVFASLFSAARCLPAWPRTALAAAVLAGLAACAQLPADGAPAATGQAASAVVPSASAAARAPAAAVRSAASASAAAAAASAAAQPGQPPAFAVVIKDAQKIDGPLTVWKKDDKVWIELAEKDFGASLFLSPKLASGIGEHGLYGGLMASNWGDFGRPQLVEFRRIHNQVQLIARNTAYTAKAGSPEARAVQAAFSPSLVSSTMVASQPHPERKTVLVDATALFSGDLLGLGLLLQRSYRQGYAWDGRNSALLSVRGKPDELVFEVLNHYASGSIAVPQPGTPPGVPSPKTPDTLPDVRSLFINVHYSLARLPEQPMAARVADQRIGHFTTLVSDFGNDSARTPKRRYVNRWRLEKKDPAAVLSEPVKPITYWIDRNVPEKYRASIRAGILEWNKAFEKIGFKDAIVVKQQADDADFDTLDLGTASVRWMTNAGASFGAIGPSHVDPRSGEILDADVGIESLSSRAVRTIRAQILGSAASTDWPALLQASDLQAEQAAAVMSGGGQGLAAAAGDFAPRYFAHQHSDACQHASLAAEQLDYALDLLAVRGELDPAGVDVDKFVQAYIKDTTMHEIGHTLGLRHNFRASHVYSEAQIADPDFTRAYAFTGSVMEYAPINLPRPGQAAPMPFQTTLGPYDDWAIEYAYRTLDADKESAELARIAARSGEPELAFATDEDNFLGVDPEALQFDLGSDPVAFASKRIEIARDLLQRLERRQLEPGQDYTILRRSVSYALRDVGRAAGVLSRQIGGVRTLRDYANTGRDPLQPVPGPQQRAALDVLASGVLSAQGLMVSPALQRRLAPDYLERIDALESGDGPVATDYSPAQVLTDLQRALLGQLMSDGVATRLLDSEAKNSSGAASLQLAELYQRIAGEVWSELSAPRGDINASRRELQREHLNRLTTQLLRPASLSRADARSLLRAQAQALLPRLEAAARRAGLSEVARAHLQDSAESLREALSAKLTRTGA
jgi:hypothetical protein